MSYTIKQVSEMLDLSAYTIRYYEKEGLLPSVSRDDNGIRLFTDKDLEWIRLVRCFRDTGMSVAEIKRYVCLCLQGDDSIPVRRQIIAQHRQAVEQKIEQMQDYLVKLNKKLSMYDDYAAGKCEDCCNPMVRS